jgi:putative heme transporter
VALHVLLVLTVLFVLRSAREVIAWILVALFLALAVDPAVRFLQARRLPRSASVMLVLLVAIGLVALLLLTLVPMVVEQGRSLAEAAPGLLERLRESSLVATVDGRLGLIERAQRELAGHVGGAAGPLVRVVGSLLRAAAAVVTTAVLTAFMLLFGGALFRSLLTWIPPHNRSRTVALVERMQRAVGGYVSGTLLIAVIGGLVTTLVLLFLGVPYFLPLGLAMMLLWEWSPSWGLPWAGS